LAPPDELLEDEPELDEPELDEPELDEPELDEPEPEPEEEEVVDELEAAAGLAEPVSEDELLESAVLESDLVSEPFDFSALTSAGRESLR
jgi:hypothetical protein